MFGSAYFGAGYFGAGYFGTEQGGIITPPVVLPTLTDYGLYFNERGPVHYVKTSEEQILVEFPWAARLEGDTIDTVAYLLPDGLANEAEIGDTSFRKVRVSGGGNGRIYRVRAQVTTLDGRVLQWTKRVRVEPA